MYLVSAQDRTGQVQSGPGRSGLDSSCRVPLPLAQLVGSSFGPGLPYPPGIVRYLADLAGLYGIPAGEDYFAQARRNSFTEMARGLLDRLGPLEEPFDLVVLAHSTPDAEPGHPACFLAHALPGEPLSFAVSDQGAVAPFTAMRIAAGYIQAGGLHRAMIVILDQSTVLRDREPAQGVPPPGTDSIAALVFERTGALGEVSVDNFADLGADQARAAAAGQLHRRFPADSPGIIVTSANLTGLTGLAGLPPGTEVMTAPPGRPCTGTWLCAASCLVASPGAPRPVAVAEYDEPLRRLSMCFIQPPASPA